MKNRKKNNLNNKSNDSGSLWVITTFFNPKRYKNKKENYDYFRKKIKEQNGNLLTVESAFKDSEYELKDEDADILIKKRYHSMIWQKERLLNVALDNLPVNCDKVVWLDADVIFLNDNWINELSKLLDKHTIVKPFNFAYRLNEKQTDEIITDFEKFKKYFSSNNKNEEFDQFYYYNNNDIIKKKQIFLSVFGLAARKDLLDNTRLYDKMINGSGDQVLTSGFFNQELELDNVPIKLENDILNWKSLVNKYINDFNHPVMKQTIFHLFHGLKSNRKYEVGVKILKNYNYDPNLDIKISEDECYEWSSNKKKMHSKMIKYFTNRNEENKIFLNILNKTYYYIDRKIGLLGKSIDRFSPRLYKFLYNIKEFLLKKRN